MNWCRSVELYIIAWNRDSEVLIVCIGMTGINTLQSQCVASMHVHLQRGSIVSHMHIAHEITASI